MEPRGGFLPRAARVAREDRTRAGEFPGRAADQLSPALVSSRKRHRLRRDPESRRHDRSGPLPCRGAVGAERGVRGLVEFRDGTAVETDDRPRPDREPAARGRNCFLREPPRARRARADCDGRGAAGQAGGALERAGRALRRGRRVSRSVFGFRRSDGRFGLAVEPGVGPRSPGAGRRLPVCDSSPGSVPARRRLACRNGCAARWSRWRPETTPPRSSSLA